MANEIRTEQHLPLFTLLELLADGQLHSGQELANLMGVSRTAIWKQLAKLAPLGIELKSVSGKGYCIPGGIELLSEQIVIARQTKSCLNQIAQLVILKTVDSTNSFLLMQSCTEKITICMAEHQTAGRGRRGRQWMSPFAKNIYLSFGVTFESGVSVLEGLSLAIGVVIANVLSRAGILHAKLKWPNDVLWQGRKLAGVLTEIAGDPAGPCRLVVGVGLNVFGGIVMDTEITQPWVSLQEAAKCEHVQPIGRNEIAAALISEIVPLLAGYERVGFAHYHAQWESLNAHAGCLVNVSMGSVVATGMALGVNAVGALILCTDKGEQIFHGGEVSLREVMV